MTARQALTSTTTRRRFLTAAGLATATVTFAGTQEAMADDYGSGQLGPWQDLSRAISTEKQINPVLANDGFFMFGDSIAVQDGYALALRLQDRTGDLIAVHNWSGRPTAPAVDALQQWASTYGLPRRIIMATGSNDIFNPPAFGPQIARTMSIVGPNRTVFWVNTQAARTRVSESMRLADQRNSAWVNLQLADAQRTYPQLRIVRWAEFLAAKLSRLTAYLSDGVHTTVPLGQDARNELIVQAVEGT
ncbi:twin-arginine translocation signal domain-containing protein [Jiangella alkaliphila]|uniref:Tat (Twin-arginine translocation) pathway signal sequence n=1 Tax=Jiangella alkaliphila TaxID=419479 RepID=A0A1H2M172_9ACTN|nr:twin-arginine translocation signal domain-containing protein [Jiangella alkaliphila]SDU86631.1 Tat (twin-arginine translocation) pathway signal sequence [Jiangella alkaliphila]